MKVVIIGKTSFLARAFIALWAESHDLILIDKGDYVFPDRSFLDGFDYQKILESELIIHCVAAGVQQGHAFSNREIMEINTFEPIRLINELEANAYQGKLITFGSYFSGAGEADSVLNEEQITNGNSTLKDAYSMSKASLSHYVNRNRTEKHIHLILTNIYGPGEASNRLFSYILESLINQAPLQFTHGKQIRQFTFVHDVVRAIDAMLLDWQDGIFNITNPELLTVREAIEVALEVFSNANQVKVKANFGDKRQGDMSIPFLGLDPCKFLNAFKPFEFTPLHQGLTTYL